jgi:hypothetical protein
MDGGFRPDRERGVLGELRSQARLLLRPFEDEIDEGGLVG